MADQEKLEDMKRLGNDIARADGFRTVVWDGELKIGDTNNEPVSLDTYLGRLCAATDEVYYTPDQTERDLLIFTMSAVDMFVSMNENTEEVIGLYAETAQRIIEERGGQNG